MATRKEKVNAGLFLLIGVLLITGTIAIVAGVSLQRTGDLYGIKIAKSVGGLHPGSGVRYLGVPVGRVQKVGFTPDDVTAVTVMIEIDEPTTPITAGTFAMLTSNFLTGETAIDLQGGGNDAQRLPPGSLLRWQPTTFMRLEDSLPGVLDELKHVVSNLNSLLGPENRERISKLVDDTDALAKDVRSEVEPLAQQMRQLKTELAGAADRIAVAAGGLRTDVTASVASGVSDLKAASKSIEAVTAKLTKVVEKLDDGTTGVPEIVASLQKITGRLDRLVQSTNGMVDDNREGLRRTLGQFESSARELARLLEQLGRNPSDLIFSAPAKEHVRGDAASAKTGKGDS